MPSSQHNIVHKHLGTQLTFAILLAVLALGLVGCSKAAPPPAEQAKRYHLVGKVVSIDLQQGSLNVDGQDIPGFMSAMMMSYPVHDAKILSTLSPGDEISADVVLVPSDNSYYLENIVVTKKGAGGSASGSRKPWRVKTLVLCLVTKSSRCVQWKYIPATTPCRNMD